MIKRILMAMVCLLMVSSAAHGFTMNGHRPIFTATEPDYAAYFNKLGHKEDLVDTQGDWHTDVILPDTSGDSFRSYFIWEHNDPNPAQYTFEYHGRYEIWYYGGPAYTNPCDSREYYVNAVGYDYNPWAGSHCNVPEPGTVLLFGTGLMGLAAVTRKRFSK